MLSSLNSTIVTVHVLVASVPKLSVIVNLIVFAPTLRYSVISKLLFPCAAVFVATIVLPTFHTAVPAPVVSPVLSTDEKLYSIIAFEPSKKIASAFVILSIVIVVVSEEDPPPPSILKLFWISPSFKNVKILFSYVTSYSAAAGFFLISSMAALTSVISVLIPSN